MNLYPPMLFEITAPIFFLEKFPEIFRKLCCNKLNQIKNESFMTEKQNKTIFKQISFNYIKNQLKNIFVHKIHINTNLHIINNSFFHIFVVYLIYLYLILAYACIIQHNTLKLLQSFIDLLIRSVQLIQKWSSNS